MLLRLSIPAIAAFTLACSQEQGTNPQSARNLATNGEVTAARVSDGVRLTNGTSASIRYVVWDAGFLGLLGIPCETCPSLGVGQSVTVKKGVDSFSGVGDAVVYYGTLRDASSVKTIIVGGGDAPKPTQPSDTTQPPNFPAKVEVSGRVIVYASGDSSSATGVAGVKIQFVRNLLVNGTPTQRFEGETATDANGDFRIKDLPGGYYVVTPLLPAGSVYASSTQYLAALQPNVRLFILVSRRP